MLVYHISCGSQALFFCFVCFTSTSVISLHRRMFRCGHLCPICPQAVSFHPTAATNQVNRCIQLHQWENFSTNIYILYVEIYMQMMSFFQSKTNVKLKDKISQIELLVCHVYILYRFVILVILRFSVTAIVPFGPCH